jgi:hypothetical protein
MNNRLIYVNISDQREFQAETRPDPVWVKDRINQMKTRNKHKGYIRRRWRLRPMRACRLRRPFSPGPFCRGRMHCRPNRSSYCRGYVWLVRLVLELSVICEYWAQWLEHEHVEPDHHRLTPSSTPQP